jgi:DNA-directed RNA polymerase II subunit RPB3
MQNHSDLEPTVRIRDLKKDRVDFVLENVDLAYACLILHCVLRLLPNIYYSTRFANSLRRVMMADIPTIGNLESFERWRI